MVLLCLKIFSARIIDVSIGTIRTLVMVRGKKVVSTILAFFEVLVWFFAARTALSTKVTSILIPISYSLGYAFGSFIGMFLSEKLINSLLNVIVITNNNDKIVNEIKKNNFGVSQIKLLDDKKTMLYILLKSHKINDLKEIINKHDENSFMIINDTKFIKNGWIK